MKTQWAVILCKFNDDNSEPFSKQYYNDLFTVNDTGSVWNMIRYFKDYSHGTLDLTGTKVFGWYQLNKSVQDYNNLLGAARAALIQWARAAATADGVDLSPFFSVVACTNLWQDIGAVSSGVVSQGSATQIPRLLGHEMGHVYGLQHSRIDGSSDDYMDPWDIMSAANDYSAADAEFSLIGPGLNAANMRSRGWLDETRVWKDSSGHDVDETIILRPLDRRDLSGFLAAETPCSDYLVEFRLREGWDGAIPRPAILVHRFDDGHSYLMPGNFGNSDLIAGDSFGDPEPALPVDIFSKFERVDVLSIDAGTRQATVRIRCHTPPPRLSGLAIDPMALILSGAAYLIWVEQHHPNEPPAVGVEAALRAMAPQEREAAMSKARMMAAYAKAVEVAIEKIGKSNLADK
jgi:hypothetical protein